MRIALIDVDGYPNDIPPNPIILGRYSNSQNGVIISPLGIAPCFAGGG